MDASAVGSLYALIALGYTMVYGTLKFINFAHGTLFTLGAWFSWVVAQRLGWGAPQADVPAWGWLVVLLLVMVTCSVLGFAIEALAYRPLRQAPRLNVLITAIGVAILLENVAQLPALLGKQPQRMPSLFPDGVIARFQEGSGLSFFPKEALAGGNAVNLSQVDAAIIGLAILLMIGLEVLVYHTRLGSAMRAVSQDMKTSLLLGINVNRTVSITFVIGSALAAAAGFLFAAKYPGLNIVSHSTWTLLGLKAFVAAVVGGIGNVRGAMVGGLLIGFLELFGAAYLSPNMRDLYVFIVLIGTLLVRPTGLFGRVSPEKV
jgi:branched-chain amino acid transport system permease protein